jgi:hypothetical protein
MSAAGGRSETAKGKPRSHEFSMGEEEPRGVRDGVRGGGHGVLAIEAD